MNKQNNSLSQQESQRYLRQIQLPSFGLDSQLRLKRARVLIVGIGGLGCPAAQYLAAAGIGELILLDNDTVQLSNLQRQILFSESDIHNNKAQAAATRLSACNSDIEIQAINEALTPDNALDLIQRCDLILDCTDNFETRYLINDICAHLNKPWIYASVLGFDGQLALIKPALSCFRCLYPILADTANCNQAGVLGAVPGVVASLQAMVAINHLTQTTSDQNQDAHNQLQVMQGGMTRNITLHKSPECKLCNGTNHDLKLINQRLSPSKNNSVIFPERYQLDWQEFQTIEINSNKVNTNNFTVNNSTANTINRAVLIDVRNTAEHKAFNIGGLNIPLETLATELSPAAGNTYIFYCQSGSRSQQAVDLMLKKLENANDKSITLKSLRGGILAKPS